MKQGITDNREAASELGSHISILVQTVVRFLETPASGQQGTVDQDTVTQLRAFLEYVREITAPRSVADHPFYSQRFEIRGVELEKASVAERLETRRLIQEQQGRPSELGYKNQAGLRPTSGAAASFLCWAP